MEGGRARVRARVRASESETERGRERDRERQRETEQPPAKTGATDASSISIYSKKINSPKINFPTASQADHTPRQAPSSKT